MLNVHSLTPPITRFGLASIVAVALYLGNALAHGPATAGTDVPLTKTVHETAMVRLRYSDPLADSSRPRGGFRRPLTPLG